jgi:phosphoribosyl 1,2-cyclic phosphodiesterase
VQLDLGLAGPTARVVVLGSGSGGNVVVLECGSRRLMIDAGFSCREIESRLRQCQLGTDSFDGLVLTHEHSDHTRGAVRFAKRHGLAIYATAGTLAELRVNTNQVSTCVIRSGEALEVGDFVVEPFDIPHDAREPVGLVVQDRGGHRIGLAADLGTWSQLVWGRLTDLDALVLETNHDLEMLRSGPYPWPLKQRVAGRHGHLSNVEAARGLPELLSDRLKWVVLYHLSRTNNLPALALEAVGEAVSRSRSTPQICVSDQGRPTPWLNLGEEGPREAPLSADLQARGEGQLQGL